MTLQEMKEVIQHGRRCQVGMEYKRRDVFDYEVIILGETFGSKKLAIKFIDKYDEQNGTWNKWKE